LRDESLPSSESPLRCALVGRGHRKTYAAAVRRAEAQRLHTMATCGIEKNHRWRGTLTGAQRD